MVFHMPHHTYIRDTRSFCSARPPAELHLHGRLQRGLQLRRQEAVEEHPPPVGPQLHVAHRRQDGHHCEGVHKLCL